MEINEHHPHETEYIFLLDFTAGILICIFQCRMGLLKIFFHKECAHSADYVLISKKSCTHLNMSFGWISII